MIIVGFLKLEAIGFRNHSASDSYNVFPLHEAKFGRVEIKLGIKSMSIFRPEVLRGTGFTVRSSFLT